MTMTTRAAALPSTLRLALLALAMLCLGRAPADAAPAPYDLIGPKLKIQVTRAGRTLPIAEVPNLNAGDQLSIKADLPPDQSAHYVLIAAFLQGSTNPPPEKWFAQSDTWKPKEKDGLRLTVPADAQQAVVMLAPETGGDFKTVMGAIRGRPGAFVRASQDLNQASLDRSRLNAFLAAVRKIDQDDPDKLKTVGPLLARSLTIKLDTDCLAKAPEQRAPCLTQGQDSLVLDDGHSTSIVQALTSGYSADLVQQLSATPRAGAGYYSPYVASVLDVARIFEGMRTAQYQYIPALATLQGEEMALLLNAPPSFQNPKSVILAALPAIEGPRPPPLHPVDPGKPDCLQRPKLVLGAEGAPLVFSGAYAHNLVLRMHRKDGQIVDAPLKADATKGGLVVDASAIDASGLDDAVEGAVHGGWGFDAWDGPVFHLQSQAGQAWRVAGEDHPSLTVGRDNTLRLQAPAAVCAESVSLRTASGQTQPLTWKPAQQGDQITVDAPLQDAQPGALAILVKSYGAAAPAEIPLQAFVQAKPFDGFAYHAKDASGVLKGGRLDSVAELDLGGVAFKPVGAPDGDALTLAAADPAAVARLKAGDRAEAKVKLKDGRTVSLATAIAPPRPSATLVSKSVQPPPQAGPASIQLASADELPRGAVLTFSIRAQAPAAFTGKDTVEVATERGAFSTTLTTASGLVLQDSQVALATLDTGKAFNASAAGPLRFRLVVDGLAGDWQPLATLVRLPTLQALNCPAQADQPCQLLGQDLFLVDQVSADPGFADSARTPEGFAGNVLDVPRPADGKLYVKLHDDPSVASALSFKAQTAATPAAAPPS